MKSPHSEDLAVWMFNHPYESLWVEHFSDGRVEQITSSSFYQLCPTFGHDDDEENQIQFLDQCTRRMRRSRQQRRLLRSGGGTLSFSTLHGFNNPQSTKMQILISGKQNITLLFNDQPNDSGYAALNYVTYRATVRGKPPRIITEFIPVDFIMPSNRQWWTNMQNNDKSSIDSATVKQLSRCTIGLWWSFFFLPFSTLYSSWSVIPFLVTRSCFLSLLVQSHSHKAYWFFFLLQFPVANLSRHQHFIYYLFIFIAFLLLFLILIMSSLFDIILDDLKSFYCLIQYTWIWYQLRSFHPFHRPLYWDMRILNLQSYCKAEKFRLTSLANNLAAPIIHARLNMTMWSLK